MRAMAINRFAQTGRQECGMGGNVDDALSFRQHRKILKTLLDNYQLCLRLRFIDCGASLDEARVQRVATSRRGMRGLVDSPLHECILTYRSERSLRTSSHDCP